jgi:hypothetical protein
LCLIRLSTGGGEVSLNKKSRGEGGVSYSKCPGGGGGGGGELLRMNLRFRHSR